MEKQRNSDCWYKEVCQDDCYMCTTYLEMKWQMTNSGLPAKLQRPIEMYLTNGNKCDRDSYKRLAEIRKNIVDFVKDGKNLYICGRSGNGKTSWAVRLLQSYFHHKAPGNYENLQGMFISTSDFLFKLKDFNNALPKEYRDHVMTVPIVIWDDICGSCMSKYDYMQFFTYINGRTLAGFTNVFTSNITSRQEVNELLGERLMSRIYDASEIIELKGGDMR